MAGELLPALPGPVQLHQHGAAQKALEVSGPLQSPLGPGGAHLQGVAALDGIGLVQQVADLAGDLLAVQDVHAALLVQQDPQIPGAGLLDVLHVPEGAALLRDGGGGQFSGQFRDFFHGRTPFF